jgi:hypothetical protein
MDSMKKKKLIQRLERVERELASLKEEIRRSKEPEPYSDPFIFHYPQPGTSIEIPIVPRFGNTWTV